MQSFNFGTEELRMLWASALLGLVQVTLAIVFSTASGRLRWALGARDEPGPVLGTIASRIERCWRNYLETFPIFAALVLLANALNRHDHVMNVGADLYFYGRLAYLPIYALGIPVLRTIAWTASIIGIVLILVGIWPGNVL